MTRVRLKGLKRVRKTLADGRVVTYVYAWVGGPCLSGQPGQPPVGSPEFMAAYQAAVAQRKGTPAETLAGLIGRYKASPEFSGLAASTRSEWTRWLERMLADPDLSILTFRLLEDRRVRADLLEWRDKWAASPRAADYAVQVMSRVLSWGVDRGLLTTNVLAGVSQLYASNRADQIWTADEVIRFCAEASPAVGYALRLACVTGLRRADLVKLEWDDVGELSLVKPTSKSRKKKLAHVPLIPEAVTLLQEIRAYQERLHAERTRTAIKAGQEPPEKPATVLCNTRCRPWSADGLETMIIKIKGKLGIDKHLHDARGTFVTRLRLAGLSSDEIAQIMAWQKERVEALLNIYVDRQAFVQSIVGRLRKNESAAEIGN